MSSADNAITADSSRQRKLGVILGYVNTAVQTVVSFLYTPLLLGGIGQSEYGLYQIIGSLTAYINIFESMLTASVLRFYCQEKSEGDAEGMETVLAVARRLYAACSCLVVVSAAAFAAFFQTAYSATLTEGELREGLAMLAIVCANIVVNMLFYTYSVVVQGNERFVFAKLLELAGLVIQPVLVIVLIGGCPQAIVISVVQLAVSLASCVVKRFYAVGRLRCRIRAHGPARRMTRSMLGFSGIMFVSMVADIVFAKTGQLLVGIAMSASAVAIFSVGYQVYQAYATLGRMVSTVFVPHVTDLSKGGGPQGGVIAPMGQDGEGLRVHPVDRPRCLRFLWRGVHRALGRRRLRRGVPRGDDHDGGFCPGRRAGSGPHHPPGGGQIRLQIGGVRVVRARERSPVRSAH